MFDENFKEIKNMLFGLRLIAKKKKRNPKELFVFINTIDSLIN